MVFLSEITLLVKFKVEKYFKESERKFVKDTVVLVICYEEVEGKIQI